MPYIHKEFREHARSSPVGAGELDYQLTLAILAYLEREGYNFAVMNTIVGVVENVKSEFQRRVMWPYEDAKCLVNGDVYPSLPEIAYKAHK